MEFASVVPEDSVLAVEFQCRVQFFDPRVEFAGGGIDETQIVVRNGIVWIDGDRPLQILDRTVQITIRLVNASALLVIVNALQIKQNGIRVRLDGCFDISRVLKGSAEKIMKFGNLCVQFNSALQRCYGFLVVALISQHTATICMRPDIVGVF